MTVAHPPTGDRNWGGRLPLADAGPLNDEQQALSDQFHENGVPWAEKNGFAPTTDDGYLIGPWNAHLHRPRVARAFNAWMGTEQAETSLPHHIREVVILTVGVAWEAPYEKYAHVAAARTIGISQSVIDGILNHTVNDDFSAAEAAAHRFADELVRTRRVSDEAYREALEIFGQDGVLDLVHLTGIYLATSAILNAFEVPAPELP